MHGPRIKIAVLFFAGLLTLLLVTKPNIFAPNRISALNTLSPILKALDSASGLVRRFLPFASYREEIRSLSARSNILSQEITRLKHLEAENDRLRNLLYFKKKLRFATTIPAEVIGRDPSNWSNSIIIDKGMLQSVRPNMAVISPKGLVGRVIETGRSSSKVLLITDPDSKDGAILEKTRQGGIVVGRHSSTCRMIYISLDTDIAAGDKVFTAGYGGIFPKDIFIGEVVGYGKEPGRLYKYAVLRTSQAFSKLEEVFCIR